MPGPAPGYGPPPDELARREVRPPGIALAVVGGGACLFYLFCALMVLIVGGVGFISDADPGGLFGGAIAGGVYGVFALLSGLMTVGAIRMSQLKSYGLAMTSAILGLVPCTTYVCCMFTFPFAVWALIVLLKPQNKAAFR